MFKFDKDGGYSVAQVDKFIVQLQTQHNTIQIKQQEQIEELTKALNSVKKELVTLKQSSEKAAIVAKNTAIKAEEVEKLSLAKYQLELQQLRAFHIKWLAYYDKIISVYPIDDALNKIAEFNAKMNNVLNIRTTTVTNPSFENANMQTYATQQKQNNNVGAKFDYREALNPKEKLSDIMRDLGLGRKDEK